MVGLLGSQEPYWAPGTKHGYHMATFGWTVGELVRRASVISLDECFRSRITLHAGAAGSVGFADTECPAPCGLLPTLLTQT